MSSEHVPIIESLDAAPIGCSCQPGPYINGAPFDWAAHADKVERATGVPLSSIHVVAQEPIPEGSAMSAHPKRAELARLLGKHYGTSAGGDDHLWAMADIVIELLNPTIETADELDALPVGSAVMNIYDGVVVEIAQRHTDHRWYVTGCREYIKRSALLPATVLHVGGAE